MEGPNKITGDLFDSVDEALHALDALILPEGYLQQSNGNKGWVITSKVGFNKLIFNTYATSEGLIMGKI